MKAQPKHMSIILHLGRNVNEYNEISKKVIEELLKEGKILCEYCLTPMHKHSVYTRGIKETGEKIKIVFVQCTACAQHHGHALLPDFILQYKQYSGNEIEGVIIDSMTQSASEIDTKASESTVKRWIKQIGERIIRAVSILKAVFKEKSQEFTEMRLTPGHCYSELEQLLEMAPNAQKYSGNKLGLANIWLTRHNRWSYI